VASTRSAGFLGRRLGQRLSYPWQSVGGADPVEADGVAGLLGGLLGHRLPSVIDALRFGTALIDFVTAAVVKIRGFVDEFDAVQSRGSTG
jgi:hypothetical protein